MDRRLEGYRDTPQIDTVPTTPAPGRRCSPDYPRPQAGPWSVLSPRLRSHSPRGMPLPREIYKLLRPTPLEPDTVAEIAA